MNYRLILLPIAIASLNTASAIVDLDNNEMSDLWEDQFDLHTIDRIAEADPDGDGWTNYQEAIAGTDPLSGEPPNGFLQINIVRNPSVSGLFVVSWSGTVGKDYALMVSADLSAESWTQVGDLMRGDGTDIEIAIDLSGGEIPEKLFWKVKVEDADQDSDGLTDAEEAALGTDPLLFDSDGDLMDDKWEVVHGLDPMDDGLIDVVNGGDGDLDGDELGNLEEYHYNTNPEAPDTDEDGMSDHYEVKSLGSNPTLTDSDENGIPDNFDIFFLARTSSVFKAKIGFRDYEPPSASSRYYLTETTT